MALIKFGGGIVQASGSIAGTTHARNRFGNYIRARTKPVNPKSSSQSLVRNAMAYLADRWHSALTPAQRAAWDLYAANVPMKNRLGDTINLTGYNHFIRSNVWAKTQGLTVVDAGPTTFSLPEKDPALAITASQTTQKISVAFDDAAAWALETGAYLILSQGTPQLLTRNFFDGPWRFCDKVDGVDSTGAQTPAEIDPVFVVTENQKIWMEARVRRLDGRLSEPFRASCSIGS